MAAVSATQVETVLLAVLAAVVEMAKVVAQAILQVHLQFKDMMAAMVQDLQLGAVEEAAVLLKLASMVLLHLVAMVEMELHLLYLVLQ